jgi:hypothetical protein
MAQSGEGSTGATDHESQLQHHCRICGRVLKNKDYKYSCTTNIDLLKLCGIDVSGDRKDIHPPSFCASCRSKVKRVSEGKQVQSSLNTFAWTEHAESGCTVCTKKKGGRPIKEKGERGRPREGSSKHIANRILQSAAQSFKAGSPLLLSHFLPPSSVSLTDLQCSVCSNIVDRPVETPCKKVVCSLCISALIAKSDLAEFSCPSCKEVHDITESSFRPASEVVMKVLGALLFKCHVCDQVVALKLLKDHIKS